MMAFDGGVLAESVTRRFRLASDELAEWRFFAADELDDALPEAMARRTRVALKMIASGGAAYLEWGGRRVSMV